MLDLESPPNICDIISAPKVADSMSIVAGSQDSADLDVEATKMWGEVDSAGDSIAVHIGEVTGVPGLDVRFTFINVVDFCFIGASVYYTGAVASHYVEFQIFDDTNAAWRTLWSFSLGNSFNYRFSDLPVTKAIRLADYINASDEVIVRFYHPTTGNNSHELFIDYVSIIG